MAFLIFGLAWLAVFAFTNVGLALGDPSDPTGINPLTVACWIEIAVLLLGAVLFYRFEMKDPEF